MEFTLPPQLGFVPDWLATHACYSPQKTAVVEAATGRRFTYHQLNALATQLAHVLVGEGDVQKGDRVSILAPNSAEYLALLFACAKVGAIFVPLNHRLALSELVPILQECSPKVLFYGEQFVPTVSKLSEETKHARCIALGQRADGSHLSLGELKLPSTPLPPPLLTPEDPWLILYTSGTTGKPKGAILSQRMITWNAINTALRDLLPSDITLTHTPMFYTGGLNVYTTPLLFLGGTNVIMRSWNAEQALEWIERERVSMFFAVPTQFLQMIESPRFATADLSSLRFVISGGAPCPVSIIEAFAHRGIVFKQGFGLTEVGPNCFCLEGRDSVRKAGSIGFPNFFVRARVVDDEGRDVAPNVVGELVLQTPAMFSGYWKNPEATREAVREGWFYTGDLARVDEEGYFYIAGRKKDMLISGGENVYPEEVEQALLAHPKVADAAVIGVPDAKWGEVGKAIVVLSPGQDATAEEILEFCRARLAKFKVPKSVVFLKTLPRTDSGKVAKQQLRRDFGTGRDQQP